MSSPERRLSEKPPTEVERKFLVGPMLPKGIYECENEYILQGYLVLGADGSEARVRKRNKQYTLTVKSQGSLTREEWETPISKEQFDTLWPATAGKRIEKTRYTIPHGEVAIELDVYEGALEGLVTAEVEFPDDITACFYVPPDWMGQEVTDDVEYKNQRLATRAFPPS